MGEIALAHRPTCTERFRIAGEGFILANGTRENLVLKTVRRDIQLDSLLAKCFHTLHITVMRSFVLITF